eukprot:SM000404S15665  [mRNA]  locus=s404:15451:25082:+ [translate_table: standard]
MPRAVNALSALRPACWRELSGGSLLKRVLQAVQPALLLRLPCLGLHQDGMSTPRSPWEYNQMFWQAVRESTSTNYAWKLGDWKYDEEDTVEMLEGRVAPKDLSPIQLYYAAEMMSLHWFRTCVMARVLGRFQVREGPHSPNETTIHEACLFIYYFSWFSSKPKVKDAVVEEPLPDIEYDQIIKKATNRRRELRRELQPQDPSWRHVVVISVPPDAFVSGCGSPFVVELLGMLRGKCKQSQEQSLKDTGAPGRGYFEHVIKEQRVTLYETVGTLKEQLAHGILFLADLVIVCCDESYLRKSLTEKEPHTGAAMALAYVLRDTIQYAFCVSAPHLYPGDLELADPERLVYMNRICKELLESIFRILESMGSMSRILGMCLDLPTLEDFVKLGMQHSFPSRLEASLLGKSQLPRPETSPVFPVFLHGASSKEPNHDFFSRNHDKYQTTDIGAIVEEHLLLLQLICSPREPGAATPWPLPLRVWDLPGHPVQGSTGADAAQTAATLPLPPMLAPQAEGTTLEKNLFTGVPLQAEQTKLTEHLLPTFSDREVPGAAFLDFWKPSEKAVQERNATSMPQLPSAPCAADHMDMRMDTSSPASMMDEGNAWAERQVVGLRFAPTDEELVHYYLRSRIAGELTEQEKILIPDKHVYETEPWNLTSKSCRVLHDAYFFCALRRKYPDGSERKGDYNRQAGKGKWKGCSTMTMPLSGVTATKRIFTYYSEDQGPIDPVPEGWSHLEKSSSDAHMQQAAAPDAVKEVSVSSKKRVRKGSARNSKTKWILHEYHIVDHQSIATQDEIVVCKLKYTAEVDSASITTELEKLDVTLSGGRSSSAKCALCSPLAWYGKAIIVGCRDQLAVSEAGASEKCTAGTEIEERSLGGIHETRTGLDDHVKRGEIDQAGGEWSRNVLPTSTALNEEDLQEGALMGGRGGGATLGEQDLDLRLWPAEAAASPQKQIQRQRKKERRKKELEHVITDDGSAPHLDHHVYHPPDHELLELLTAQLHRNSYSQQDMERLMVDMEKSREIEMEMCREIGERWKATQAAEVARRLAKEESRLRTEAMAAARAAQTLAESQAKPREEAEAFEQNTRQELLDSQQRRYRTFTWEELQAATDNFSEKIGEGGYGWVFRGRLHHTDIAIKVLKSTDASEGRSEEFQHEVELLGRMQHPHMVMLLGCCVEVTDDGSCRFAIVYDYCANGNLEEHLSGQAALPWHTRIRVAAEVTSALVFLHSNDPPILHRALKAANILLDQNLVGKLADVGMAELMPGIAGQLRMRTHVTQTIAVGTLAYVDPEFYWTGRWGTKSDVYSLGIVLLQLLTGKVQIMDKVEDAVQRDNLESVLDPASGKWPRSVALELALLALECVKLRRKDRPEVASVMAHLDALRTTAKEAADKEAPAQRSFPLEERSIKNFCSEMSITKDRLQAPFSYEELMDAIKDFNPIYIVGCGALGKVYGAQMKDGQKYAVKKLASDNKQGLRLVKAELEVLSRICHRNVVPLRGWYIPKDSDVDMLLIYPFLPGGNLDQLVHGGIGVPPKPEGFDHWAARKKVMLGAAVGLRYLHHGCNDQVLHRDIKPSNTLLDEHGEGYVADFGLARTFQAHDTHVSTMAAGTVGYIGPDCALGQLTTYSATYSDVFNFGVMLLETVTGKRPVDPFFQTEAATGGNLISWVRSCFRHEKPLECVDIALAPFGPQKVDEIRGALRAGLLCCSYIPTMDGVVEMLQNLGAFGAMFPKWTFATE